MIILEKYLLTNLKGKKMQVILYTMNNCPKCRMQKAHLDSLNIQYETKDLMDNLDFARENNIQSAPALVIDNKIYTELVSPIKLKELLN